MTPERHLAENAGNRPRLVSPACIRQRVGRVTRGVEAAVAGRARDWMGRDGQGKRIVLEAALGHDRPAERPHEVVEHGAEAQARVRLDDRPRAPAGDWNAELAKCASGLHQRALASRASAGWMTSSTSP